MSGVVFNFEPPCRLSVRVDSKQTHTLLQAQWQCICYVDIIDTKYVANSGTLAICKLLSVELFTRGNCRNTRFAYWL